MQSRSLERKTLRNAESAKREQNIGKLSGVFSRLVYSVWACGARFILFSVNNDKIKRIKTADDGRKNERVDKNFVDPFKLRLLPRDETFGAVRNRVLIKRRLAECYVRTGQ